MSTTHANRQFKLNNAMIDAAYAGKLKKIIRLLTDPTYPANINANPYDTYASPIAAACHGGKLEVVQYLLNCEKSHLIYRSDIQIGLVQACQHGHLEVVKYLLLEHDDKVDIHQGTASQQGTPLETSFTYKQVKILDFFLNHPQFKHKINHEKNYFQQAVLSGSLAIIQLFLAHPDFVHYPPEKFKDSLINSFYSEDKKLIDFFIHQFDFKAEYENVFLSLCEQHATDNIIHFNRYYDFKESLEAWEKILTTDHYEKDTKIITYLLTEKQWKPTKDIKNRLYEFDDIKSLLNKRDLFEQMNRTLENKNSNHHKNKI